MSNNLLEEIKNLSNSRLLDLFDLMVRVNHYDPCETPSEAKKLLDNDIDHEVLFELVLERMERMKN